MLQATIANVNRSKRSKAYEPKQFLPKWGRAPERQGPMSGEELLDKVKQLHKRMGGR